MIWYYLKIAWRNCINQKIQSLINLTSLAIALSASLLIVIWVDNELRFNNYHPAAERTYLVKNTLQTDVTEISNLEHSPYPLAASLSTEFPEVELVTQFDRSLKDELVLQVNNQSFPEEYIIYVGKNWFSMFRYEFLAGEASSFFAHPASLIVTESKARQIWGRTDCVGKNIKIDSTEYTVRGVIRDNPVNSSFQYNILLPLSVKLATKKQLEDANTWLYATHRTFVQLRPDARLSSVENKISKLYQAKRGNHDLRASLLPLKDIHFDNKYKISAFVHGDPALVKIFSLLAFSLVFAACINYVNLSIARTASKAKDIGVRKIIGAERSQLFLQVLAECVLISLFAFALTIMLILIVLPSFNTFTEVNFSFSLFDVHLVGLLASAWLFMMLSISIYPAILLSAINPADLLRRIPLFQIKNSVFRNSLTSAQFALTIVLIIGAITVYQQFDFMQKQHVVYDRGQIVTVPIPKETVTITSFEHRLAYDKQRESQIQALKEELLHLIPIKHVSRMNMESVINYGYTISGDTDWEGKKADQQPAYVAFSADEDLNAIMKFRVVQGRWFDKDITSDKENTILNETAVKNFGLAPPVIGKRFNKGHIIGVVRDFHHQNMRDRIGPVVIQIDKPNRTSLLIETHPGKTANALLLIERTIKKHFPGAHFSYSFMNQEFEKLYKKERKAMQIMSLLTVLSIFISCLGLFSIAALSIEKRIKEIGIRKVLGASVTGIILLLSKDFLKIVLLAILVASPLAWYAVRDWLQTFAYHIDMQWWVFVLSGLFVIGIGLLTVSFQTIKASITNPVKNLRSE